MMGKFAAFLMATVFACGVLDASAQSNPAPASWQGTRTAGHGVCYQNTGQGVTLQDASTGKCLYPAGIDLSGNIVKAGAPAPIITPPTGIYEYVYPSGSCTGTPGSCALNYFYANDSATSGLNAVAAGVAELFNIGYLWGGSGDKGNRIPVDVSVNLAAPTGNGISGYGAVAVRASAYMKSNDNGTDNALNSSGNITGVNAVAELLNGATYIRGMQAGEFDYGADAGTSMQDKIGVQITELGNDAAVPARGNIALMLTSQGNVGTGAVPGVATGLSFGGQAGWSVVNATGTLIQCTPHQGGSTCPGVADGVDLSAFASFSDAAFKSPGFAVDGAGNISMNGTLTSTVANWTIKSAVPTGVSTYTIGDVTVRNAVQFQLALSTQPSIIRETGVDANRDLWIQAAGTGSVWVGSANNIAGDGGGLRVTDTGAGPAANILSIGPTAAGAGKVSITCGGPGSDAVVDCFFTAKGVASYDRFLTNSTSVALDVIDAAGGAASTNHLIIQPGVSGAPTILSVGGADANADFQIKPLGTGTLQMGNTGSFAANGTVATAMASVGPTGAATAPRKWFIIKDSTGAPYYLPAF